MNKVHNLHSKKVPIIYKKKHNFLCHTPAKSTMTPLLGKRLDFVVSLNHTNKVAVTCYTSFNVYSKRPAVISLNRAAAHTSYLICIDAMFRTYELTRGTYDQRYLIKIR